MREAGFAEGGRGGFDDDLLGVWLESGRAGPLGHGCREEPEREAFFFFFRWRLECIL